MKRRKLIKSTLKGLPILLMAPTLVASACENKTDKLANNKKIIVVGAGISGLAAAKKLHEKGYDVVVLESHDKVGGRLRTDRSIGIAFDEGASWIHGINGNPITNLARQAGMTTATTDDDSILCYDLGGKLRSDSSYSKAEDELYHILDTMMSKGSISQSFETVFNNLHPTKVNDRLWKFLLSTYVTFDLGDRKSVV